MINRHHVFERIWTARILIAFQAESLNAYFQYTDCDAVCVEQNISCVIVEINPTYFPCECLVDGDRCAALATDMQVCLRPHVNPIGGENIWHDFERHRNTNVSTTTQAPSPTSSTTSKPPIVAESCYQFIAPLTTLALTNAATCIALIYLLFKQRSRTSTDYSRMPRDRTVYKDTVREDSEDKENA